MRTHNLLLSTLLVCTCHAAASAQSLADVAAAEAARRRAMTLPSKVYTNDSLSAESRQGSAPATLPPVALAPSTPASSSTLPDQAKKEEIKQDETKTEKYWKDRMTAVQQGLARNKVLTDAMQSRINTLRADALNIDEPGQRAIVQANLNTAVGEMERLKQEHEKYNKDLTGIQDEARRANVSPGWLR
jgi:hypothetical protein